LVFFVVEQHAFVALQNFVRPFAERRHGEIRKTLAGNSGGAADAFLNPGIQPKVHSILAGCFGFLGLPVLYFHSLEWQIATSSMPGHRVVFQRGRGKSRPAVRDVALAVRHRVTTYSPSLHKPLIGHN
jgi:hypothetical protein